MYPGDPFGSPESVQDMGCTEVTLTVSETRQIPALDCHQEGSADAPPAIVLGGNGMNMYSSVVSMPGMLPRTPAGWRIFSVSFPGEQYGTPGWTGPALSLADAKALLAYATGQTGGRRIIVFGWSLGSSLAAGLAAAEPRHVQCAILGNPFTSMREEVLAVTGYVMLPWLYLFDEWPTASWARALNSSTIVLSSREDQVIPWRMHTEVYQAVGATKKRLIEKDGSHMSFDPFVPQLDRVVSDWCMQG